MEIESVIQLDELFKPRHYQWNLIRAFQSGCKNMVAIHPRRSGKDYLMFQLMFRAALKRVGIYYYILPTYRQGRDVIWNGMTIDGKRFLDFIPEQLIESKHEQYMRIRLFNGSSIQIIGSDNYDKSIRGTNPVGVVLSEYSWQNPDAYIQGVRPIMAANNGWVAIISTPRGKNALWHIYSVAKENPDRWFSELLTINETGHISPEEIQRERQEGLMSEDLIQQEYFCSFECGIEGSYYGKYIDRMRVNGQLTTVPWEPGHKVHTIWDIGYRDATSIIFVQVIGPTIRIIDFYEKSKEGLEHYVRHVKSKDYIYGVHIAPHDIEVTEYGTAETRKLKARRLGIDFMVAPHIPIIDGIEAVRSNLTKMWIDDQNCGKLIRALENYRQEYDSVYKVYKDKPVHDQFSHAADAMRYLCVSLGLLSESCTAGELDRRYQDALYGNQSKLPPMFRDDNRYY